MKKCESFNRVSTMIMLFVLAAGLIGYPFLSNYLFEHRTDSVVNTVMETVDKEEEAEKEAMRQKAQAYNTMILNGYVQQKTSLSEMMQAPETEPYHSLLNASDDGVMGVVEIPEIEVRLPVYHGTDAEVLEKGVGHLQGTSLPVGGEGTHAVLTGHTGLSSAKLFTDLTEMEEGDVFYLHVLGERLVYEVNQIRTVLPTDMADLYVEEGKDYCTLLTCTPYGANTHRLLVRGERKEETEITVHPVGIKRKSVHSRWMEEYRKALLISLLLFVVGLVVLLVYWNLPGKQVKRQHQQKKQAVKTCCGGKTAGRKRTKGEWKRYVV